MTLKKKNTEIEIITPCFNEGENVDIFIWKFIEILELNNLNDFLITVVDDGSDNNTRDYSLNIHQKKK